MSKYTCNRRHQTDQQWHRSCARQLPYANDGLVFNDSFLVCGLLFTAFEKMVCIVLRGVGLVQVPFQFVSYPKFFAFRTIKKFIINIKNDIKVVISYYLKRQTSQWPKFWPLRRWTSFLVHPFVLFKASLIASLSVDFLLIDEQRLQWWILYFFRYLSFFFSTGLVYGPRINEDIRILDH